MKYITTFKAVALCAALALAGCTTDANHGLTAIVGDHYTFPKLTQESSNTAFEIYESTEGAVVKCRKDCRVTVTYDMTSTNHIVGCWDKGGSMRLGVTVEPVESATTNATAALALYESTERKDVDLAVDFTSTNAPTAKSPSEANASADK